VRGLGLLIRVSAESRAVRTVDSAARRRFGEVQSSRLLGFEEKPRRTRMFAAAYTMHNSRLFLHLLGVGMKETELVVV
jgi:hypothetical protein